MQSSFIAKLVFLNSSHLGEEKEMTSNLSTQQQVVPEGRKPKSSLAKIVSDAIAEIEMHNQDLGNIIAERKAARDAQIR